MTLDPRWRAFDLAGSPYLWQILERENVDTSINSPVRVAQTLLMPIIQTWAGNNLLAVQPSGSFVKGTAVKTGTDIDLFISLSENTPETLGDIYEKLFRKLKESGYEPKRQNVSINIKVGLWSVDLVPGKRQNAGSADHSLYRRRANSWTKTNVLVHAAYVAGSGRQPETKIIKLWRNQKGLDFPSFYLELAVIRALIGCPTATTSLGQRVQAAFEYLASSFLSDRAVDPANTNNVISDDLTAAEKMKVRVAAAVASDAASWSEVIT